MQHSNDDYISPQVLYVVMCVCIQVMMNDLETPKACIYDSR